MSNVVKTLKKTWLKGMEAVGNAASNIADNAKYKVNEMNLETRRREILADFGSIAYEMWQRGEAFPPELDAQLHQLNALDEQLNAIRAQRYAAAREAKIAQEAAEEAARKTGLDPLSQEGELPEEAPDTSDAPDVLDAPEASDAPDVLDAPEAAASPEAPESMAIPDEGEKEPPAV